MTEQTDAKNIALAEKEKKEQELIAHWACCVWACLTACWRRLRYPSLNCSIGCEKQVKITVYQSGGYYRGPIFQ